MLTKQKKARKFPSFFCFLIIQQSFLELQADLVT